METPLPRVKNLVILDGIQKGLGDSEIADLHDVPINQVETLRRNVFIAEQISPTLLEFIERRDKRCAKPDNLDPISRYMEALLKEGQVKVSGRRSNNDGLWTSWRRYSAWNSVVEDANKEGLRISRTFIQSDNPPPEVPHGCWESCLYELEPSGEVA